jgi:hypothetical protein
LHLASLPGPDDPIPVLDTLKRGDYFVTSGEVLIPSYSLQGTGSRRKIVADVEWTFPLDFVEVVWGDGNEPIGRSSGPLTCRRSERTTSRFHRRDRQEMGALRRVEMAGNGAAVQPVKLNLPIK